MQQSFLDHVHDGANFPVPTSLSYDSGYFLLFNFIDGSILLDFEKDLVVCMFKLLETEKLH